MSDNAIKDYVNQFLGFKRYQYQDKERVEHIYVVMGTD
ncbi:phage protein, partial [Staphylococcus aureus]